MGSVIRESKEHRQRRPRAAVLAAIVAWGLATPSRAHAQLHGGAPTPTAQGNLVALGGDGDPEGAEVSSLKRAFGFARSVQLLESADPGERLRAIERLGELGTDEAIGALVAALEQGAALGREPRARLVAVRAIAPHGAKESARRWLTREASDTAEEREGETPLARLTRETAALALARSGHAEALGDLARLVAQEGPAAQGARDALLAYPPGSFESIAGRGDRPLPPAVMKLLADLGDLRALPRLRKLAAEREPSVAAGAIVALARLGDGAALGPAKALCAHSDERLARAGTEALVRLDAPEAAAAIAGLLRRDGARSFGLKLSLDAPSPALAAELVRTLPLLAAEERPLAVAALGRAGGRAAVAKLTALLDDATLAPQAAHALATLPGDEARRVIEGAMAKAGAAGLLGLRAGIVRALVLGRAPEGLAELLTARLTHTDPTTRAAAAFGLVALEERDPAELADGRDAAVTIGALRGALARGPDALAFALPLFVRVHHTAPGSPLATAAASALLARPDAPGLSATELAELAEAGGSAGAVAALAFARRDQPLLRPRITRLLGGSDPLVRSHTALGLGASAEPDATSLLAEAYTFETDARARRAITRALAARPGRLRERTLALAAALDPDAETRALARLALTGAPPRPAGAGPAVAWLDVVGSDGSRSAAEARFVRSDGLALPVVTDPDGTLLVPGTPDGLATLVLAPPTGPRDPAHR